MNNYQLKIKCQALKLSIVTLYGIERRLMSFKFNKMNTKISPLERGKGVCKFKTHSFIEFVSLLMCNRHADPPKTA
jgi:hypothetical protein